MRHRNEIGLIVAFAFMLGFVGAVASAKSDSSATGPVMTMRPRDLADALRFGRGDSILLPALLPDDLAWVKHDSADPDCRKGYQSLCSGDWNAATNHYSAALNRNPKNAVALANRAVATQMDAIFVDSDPLKYSGNGVVIDKKRFDRLSNWALEDWEAADKLHPDCGRFDRNAAVTYRWAHRLTLAKTESEKSVALNPHDAINIVTLAMICKLVGNTNEGISLLDRAIREQPKFPALYCMRGALFWRKGDNGSGITDETKAIALEPNNYRAFYERALLYVALRKFDQAIADLKMSVSLKPDKIDAWCVKGNLEFFQNRFEDALADGEHAVKMDGANPAALCVRGQAYLGLKRYTEAVKDLDRAIALDPKKDRFRLCRARAFVALNKRDKALTDLNSAITINPGNRDALKLRAQLSGATGDLVQSTSEFDQAGIVVDDAKGNLDRGNFSRMLLSPSEPSDSARSPKSR
jgi:tetratricopeptide (TPR) repeat protein